MKSKGSGALQLWLALWALTCCHVAYDIVTYRRQTRPTAPEQRAVRPTDKWIVVDSTRLDCVTVNWEPLSQDSNPWNVVVLVRQDHTAFGCHPPVCIEMSREFQTSNPRHLSLLWAFQSKEIKHLFAYAWVIARGATSILDVDCTLFYNSNVNTIVSNMLNLESNNPHLLYKSSPVFDPFYHFGYKSNDKLRQQFNFSAELLRNQSIYHLETPQRLYIKHGFSASCNQSVEGTVQKARGYVFNTPVSLGDGVFFHFSHGPTLFHKPAFWFLFRPPGMDSQQTALFRSLWLFSMRREFHMEMSVHDFNEDSLDKTRSPSYLQTYQEVNLKYVVKCVEHTRCPKEFQLHACVLRQLQNTLRCLSGLVTGNYPVEEYNMSYFLTWIENLASLGVNLTEDITDHSSRHSSSTPLTFSLLNQNTSSFTQSQQEKINKHVFQRMISICSNYSKKDSIPHSVLDWRNPRIDDIMLIVVLNYETVFGAVLHTEYIHRPVFKYIVYCGPALQHFVQFADDLGLTYLTYIEGLPKSWHYMYECLAHAMKLGAPVRGYLHIGDDVLLNAWNIQHLHRDRVWIPGGFMKLDIYETVEFREWVHWAKPYGRPALLNVFEHLKNASEENSTSTDTNPKTQYFRQFALRFLENYKQNIGLEYVLKRAIDFLYIPSRLMEDYSIASDLFRSYGCFIELAVPAIHLGIALKKDVIYVEAQSVWGENRLTPWKFYSAKGQVFLHPFKAMSDINRPETRTFFCNTFMDDYLRFLSPSSF
ncbi:uncharacterized protein LOC101860944 [Aplysia californica]|uniref:Uncharacterized protein LOC101860944 n=1 Tax=Aplysia californica TaxID=6500 RepID=A0ABM1ABB4_APLCA|nr:uncharacterized protein LOC101860944 [Aplysia californica]